MNNIYKKTTQEKFRLSWVACVIWFLVLGPIFSGFCIMIFGAISVGEVNPIKLALLWFAASAMIFALMSGMIFLSSFSISATLIFSIVFSALLFKALVNMTIYKFPYIYNNKKYFILISGCIGAFSTTASWFLLTINDEIKLKSGIAMIEVAPTGLLLGLLLGVIYSKKNEK